MTGEASPEQSVSLAAKLPALSECADAVRLLRLKPLPPADAELMQAIAAARVQRDTGRFQEARAASESLVQRARAIGDARAEAAARSLLATTLTEFDDKGAAKHQMLAASEAAERAGDERRVVATRANYAKMLRGEKLLDDAFTWLDLAQRALERGGGDAALEANLLLTRAQLLADTGHTTEAVALGQRALAMRLGAHPRDEKDIIWAHLMLGETYELARDREAQLRELQAVYPTLLQIYGPNYQETLNLELDIGDALRALKRYPEAREWIDRALAHELSELGPDSIRVARAYLKRALLLRDLHDSDAAIAAANESLKILARHDDNAELRQWTTQSLRILGEVELERGHARAAIAPLERAYRMVLGGGAEHDALAFLLARALSESKLDEPRAQKLLAEARAGSADGSPASRDLLAEMSAWEAARTRAPK